MCKQGKKSQTPAKKQLYGLNVVITSLRQANNQMDKKYRVKSMKNREKEENKAQKYQEGYIDQEKEQEGDLSYLYGGHYQSSTDFLSCAKL